MRSVIFLIICLFIFLNKAHCGKSIPDNCAKTIILGTAEGEIISNEAFIERIEKRPSPLLKLFRKKQARNKKLTAAALAFPFPFGIVGLHRIYLGSAPYVPVVYIATVGGAFGLLPFIDFCVILSNKTTDRYVDNKNVFMWVD